MEFTDIAQWNCEGAQPKKGELEIIAFKKKPICFCVGETKLKYEASFKISGYQTFLKNLLVPPDGNAHGGVAIFVKNGVSALEIDLNTNLQAVAVSVKFHKRISICSVYLPPGQPITKEEIEGLIGQLPRPFLLLGDFNARSKLWYDSDYCQRGKMIEKLIEEGDFFFLDRNSNTHFSRRHKSYSHVDLSLCSLDLIDDFQWEVDEDYHNSDHTPIYLKSNNPRHVGGPARWITKKANWVKFQEKSELTNDAIHEDPDIDTTATYFENIISNAAAEAIPASKGTGNKKSPPWWNNACKNAIKKRKAAWRRYTRDSTDDNYNKFSRLRAQAQRILRCSKAACWSDLINSINPDTESGELWRKINLLQGKMRSQLVSTLKINKEKVLVVEGFFDIKDVVRIARTFGKIMDVQDTDMTTGGTRLSIRFDTVDASNAAMRQLNGGQYSSMNISAMLLGNANDPIVYDTPEDLANCLGKRFEFVSSSLNCDDNFNQNRAQREHPVNFSTNRRLGYNDPITRKEMDTALDSRQDTSPGPDDIHYSMLQNLPESGKNFLLEFLNKIFDRGKLPKKWKRAYVIPILKVGSDPTSPDSYRPIALTSCVCKLLERILNKRLMWFLIKNNLIDKNQTGFQVLKSTLDNLAAMEKEIHDAIARKQFLIAVFFYLEKAYDTCWRHLILKELHRLGLRGKLPMLIVDFLQDRKFQVRIGKSLSREFNQEMGVPQGSVLSCTLFLIAINTVMRILTGNVAVSLYVDDMKISIASPRLASATRRMQSCLRQLDLWTADTGFRFSSSKTEVVVFHRQRGLAEDPAPDLFLKETKLKVVTEKKFLGLIFDSKLNWVPHIKSLKARGIKALSLLKIIVKNNKRTTSQTLLNIYRAIVRSKLDYGSQIYGTATTSALRMLDTVHHQGLRICTGAFRTSPVDSLYVESGEPSLSDRRRSLQLQYYIRSKRHYPDRSIVQLDDDLVDHFYQALPSKPRSLGIKVRQYIHEIGLEIPPISMYSVSDVPPWDYPEFEVCTALSVLNKSETNPEEFLQYFREHKHIADIEMYTDGSKDVNGVGAGFGSFDNMRHNRFFRRKLNSLSSVFTAELYAIKSALLLARLHQNRSIVIYSDSRSALQAIQKLESTNNLVQEIITLIKSLAEQQTIILLCWIPSHVGIEGNELADKAAKDAIQGDVVNRNEASDTDVIAHIKHKLRLKWEDRWDRIEDNRKLRAIQPTLERCKFKLTRRDQVKITRLRIGHTRLTHGSLLIGQGLPECIECTWDEEDPQFLTVKHILMECGNYALARTPFFDPAVVPMDKLLSDQEYVEIVIEFLKRAELYSKI